VIPHASLAKLRHALDAFHASGATSGDMVLVIPAEAVEAILASAASWGSATAAVAPAPREDAPPPAPALDEPPDTVALRRLLSAWRMGHDAWVKACVSEGAALAGLVQQAIQYRTTLRNHWAAMDEREGARRHRR